MDALELRVEKLEATNRRLLFWNRWLILIMAMAIPCVVTYWVTQIRGPRFSSIELYNGPEKQPSVRITATGMEFMKNGVPTLWITNPTPFDEGGGSGAAISMFDQKGQQVWQANVGPEGRPVMAMQDPHGKLLFFEGGEQEQHVTSAVAR